jgi:hypothetical protein
MWQATSASIVVLGSTTALWAAQVGVWQFDGNLDNSLPGKTAMSVAGGWTPTYVDTTINGSAATALSFPKFDNSQALQMPNEAGATGGGAQTNAWTLVMDVNFPTISGFTSLWQTDQVISGSDGDLFVRGNNDGIGIGGSYHGTIAQDTWHRVAVAIQPSGTSYLLEKYIDGALVGTTTSGTPLDGRHAVKNVLNLFADEDGETAAGFVNSVAYYSVALSANEIGALGAASGGGVPSVPEPSTALLLVGGLASLGLRRRG